jgi:hypothetical protein
MSMLIVNVEKCRSLNLNGTEFLADQPIPKNFEFLEGQKESLLKGGELIETEEDAEALRKSERFTKETQASTEAAGAARGLDLSDPAGLTAEQRKAGENDPAVQASDPKFVPVVAAAVPRIQPGDDVKKGGRN